MNWRRHALLLGILAAAVAAQGLTHRALCADETLPEKTALDEYVHKPDPSYSWKVVDSFRGNGVTTYIVDLKSQTWRTPEEVDRPLWEHWLIVVQPDEMVRGMAFLRIGGEKNTDKRPESASDFLLDIATQTKTVAAEVLTVPNQPLEFYGDGKKRVEDDLVAFTQSRFLETQDVTWPARNPMVKSAVRAMDAVQELLASEQGGEVEIEQFVVSGGSKRGWTTWLTGAVDDRVAAIIPVVIDTLNLKDARLHRFASYGFWAPSLKDYVHHRVMQRMDLPAMQDLMRLVDPYFYRHRLTLPKYIVNASGDQFFPPDASQFYYDDLLGEKHLRYVPNANHSLQGSDARKTILAFYRAIVNETPRPRYTWELRDDGSFAVKCIDKPTQVVLWQAHNPEARDFRVEEIGKVYTDTKLTESGDGVYVGRVETPEQGFRAFFVELTYDTGHPEPLRFTTSVHILPDVLPFADKDPRVPEETE